jgi:hypothetical protein
MAEEKVLGFVTEIGTFGSMPIKDPTVQPVTELREVMETTNDPDLKKYIKDQINKK